ncbi:von willebrand factor type A domain-containing protein [Ditylenchus destructor]|nr:von willebrand factor type A domain-containing protein [Ditylenchus destructor]
MVQESTMICVDNSEYMRNGDMSPNRMQCQQEAVRVLIQFKLRSNPENAIGMLSMAKNIDVLSSMTQEDRKVLARLHQVPIEGLSQVIRAIKTAHLVLKNRPNRNHKTRVVVFIGSPLDNIESDFGPGEMQKLAKKLKKENVKADFVLFGEATAENNQVILDFVDTLNGKDGSGSNVVVVPGDAKLFEALLSSPICRNEDGTGGGEFDFGMDGDDDPELALALRVSLEEQRQRQQAEVAANAPPTANGGEAAQNMEAAHASSGTAGGEQIATPLKIDSFDPAGMTEEEQIQWALRMSMAPDSPEGNINIPVTSTASNSGAGGTPAPTPMEAEMGEEESQKNRQHSTALGQLMENPELLKQLVDQIPGTTSAGKDKQKDEKKDTKDEDK